MSLVGLEVKPVGNMDFVDMAVKSSNDWSSDEDACRFVDILVSEDAFLLPEKFDKYQPEQFVFDPKDLTKLIEIWTSDIR